MSKPTKASRGGRNGQQDSYAPKVLVYLITSPPHRLLLAIASLSILVVIFLSFESVKLEELLDATSRIVPSVKTHELFPSYRSWEEATRDVNATPVPLGKAVEEGLILRYSRALVLDGRGRFLIGRRDAPGLDCFQSYELGATIICKAEEDALHCALRALSEEARSEEAYLFPAVWKAQQSFSLYLDDDKEHHQLVDFVCAALLQLQRLGLGFVKV